jgi:HSP20 family protein
MTITRWEPFRELANLQHRVNNLLQDYRGPQNEELLSSGSFLPAVDILENEHDFVLKLEVPGIDQKDVQITLENNTLTVRGERKIEKDEKQENFRRVERSYGSFVRTFALPNTIDAENVNAEYHDGILKIRLAKKQEAKPKQIKIGINTAKQVDGKTAA